MVTQPTRAIDIAYNIPHLFLTMIKVMAQTVWRQEVSTKETEIGEKAVDKGSQGLTQLKFYLTMSNLYTPAEQRNPGALTTGFEVNI